MSSSLQMYLNQETQVPSQPPTHFQSQTNPNPNQNSTTNPLIKPFAVLALPGVYLYCKYNQFKQRRQESAKKRITERELQLLHQKIDKLLIKLDETEQESASCPEDECVICTQAKATMQTIPCGHRVVCRKCFVKTIQSAVCRRILPLRCVICREKILKLSSCADFGLLSSSVSQYSFSSVSSNASSTSSTISLPSNFNTSKKDNDVSSSVILRKKRSFQQINKGHDRNRILPPIKELTPYSSPLILPKHQTKLRITSKLETISLRKPKIHLAKSGYKNFVNEDCDSIGDKFAS